MQLLKSIIAGLLALAWIVQADLSLAQVRAGAIQRITVIGANRIDPETVGSYLQLKVGDPFDPARMDQSLKALFATGLFRDVQLRQEGFTLVVQVIENPIINRIAYEGNSKLKDADLASEIPLRARAVYNQPQVEASVRRILEIYRATGRFGVTVTPKIIELPQNRVNLVFEINEGEVTAIRRIRFVGNKYYSDSELLEEVDIKESVWWRFLGTSDVYDPDRLNADREKLRKFYLSRGFADARIIAAVAEITPDKNAFFITFTIEEGERYRFGKIDITTSLRGVQAEQFRRGLRIREGQRFDGNRIEATVDMITNVAGSMGYAFVRVNPILTPDRERKIVAVTFDVREGPKVFVERIEIRGNVRTRDEVIRREMRLAEGDAFNTDRIRLSQRRLTNLNYFEKVDIQPREGSARDRVILTVSVLEKATGELSLGAGFSTDEGVLGSIGLRETNFMGRGQVISVAFFLSQRSTALDFSFTEPYFLERNLLFGVDAFRRSRDFSDEGSFTTRETGGRIRFGYRLTEDITQLWQYEINDRSIRDIFEDASPFIKMEEGRTTTSSISSTITYDTRDHRFFPTDGYIVAATVQFAGLGGSERFIKGILRGGAHYSVRPGWVVSLMGEGGIIQGLGKDVGLGDRFFIGGDTMRGFAVGGIGPRDRVTDDALGANKYYVVTAELTFPLGLPKEFGIVGRVFTDIGSSWDIDIEDPRILDRASPRISAGVGVSWSSPFGPLRVDLGFPVLKFEGDRTQVFHFRFGARF